MSPNQNKETVIMGRRYQECLLTKKASLMGRRYQECLLTKWEIIGKEVSRMSPHQSGKIGKEVSRMSPHQSGKIGKEVSRMSPHQSGKGKEVKNVSSPNREGAFQHVRWDKGRRYQECLLTKVGKGKEVSRMSPTYQRIESKEGGIQCLLPAKRL